MTVQTLSPDPRLEEWIESHGNSYELKSIPIGGINQTRSLSNQSRFQALDEGTVITYAAAMERGDKFPPIVVYMLNGAYVVIDGNHRVSAANLAALTSLDAYVVTDPTERQIQTMTFEANAKHGLPSSPEERIEHGLFLMDAGVSMKDAAALVNLALATLTQAAAKQRANRRYGQLGIDRWDTIAASNRSRLSNIRNDTVFTAASKLAIEAKLGGPAINDLVTEINKANSETEQLAVVDTVRSQAMAVITSTAGGRVPTPISLLRLSRSLAYSDGVDPAELPKAVAGLTRDQQKALSARVTRTVLIMIEAKRVLDGAVQ